MKKLILSFALLLMIGCGKSDPSKPKPKPPPDPKTSFFVTFENVEVLGTQSNDIDLHKAQVEVILKTLAVE